MLRVERIGWGQFLHGSACGGRVREKKDAVNGYAETMICATSRLWYSFPYEATSVYRDERGPYALPRAGHRAVRGQARARPGAGQRPHVGTGETMR
jgi:hypothetical protein